jgi:hypothetical protein
VFDAPGQGILRKMVSWLGLDDPQQVMGVGAAMDVGPMGGGLIDAVAQRFPRFAAAIKAYHGSPHDFEAFDTSKIGTGEGAQAYGHGLYFAENPQVAEEYKKAFTGSARDAAPVRYQNIEYPSGTSMHRDLADMKAMGKDAWMAEAQKAVDFNKTYAPDQAALWQSRIKTMQSVDPSLIQVNTPKMYEVGINAHPDQFLDWDKPFSQQTPEVQDAVTKALKAIKLPEDFQTGLPLWLQRDPTGESIHAAVSAAGRSNREGQAIGSARLKEAGIPGIKYLDQGSRITAGVNKLGDNWFIKGSMTPYPTQAAAEKAAEAAGNVSRNFVVFDAKTIDILKKYGLLPPAVGATIAAQQQAQPNGSGQ